MGFCAFIIALIVWIVLKFSVTNGKPLFPGKNRQKFPPRSIFLGGLRGKSRNVPEYRAEFQETLSFQKLLSPGKHSTSRSWNIWEKQLFPDYRNLPENCQQCANSVHCKRRGSEKSIILAIFGGFDFLRCVCSLRTPLENPLILMKSQIFANTPCKPTCLHNAPRSAHC